MRELVTNKKYPQNKKMFENTLNMTQSKIMISVFKN